MDDAPTKIIPPNHPDNNTIVGSDTTGHFTQATSVWMNRKLTKYLISVTLPYWSRVKLTHTTMLSLQNLIESARREHIFTELKSRSLLYMSQIIDQICTVNFTADQVSITLDKQTILTGPRDRSTCLCTVPLFNPPLTQPKPWVPPPTICQCTRAIQIVQPPSVIRQASNNAFATNNKRS